jgi:hypothetical protein
MFVLLLFGNNCLVANGAPEFGENKVEEDRGDERRESDTPWNKLNGVFFGIGAVQTEERCIVNNVRHDFLYDNPAGLDLGADLGNLADILADVTVNCIAIQSFSYRHQGQLLHALAFGCDSAREVAKRHSRNTGAVLMTGMGRFFGCGFSGKPLYAGVELGVEFSGGDERTTRNPDVGLTDGRYLGCGDMKSEVRKVTPRVGARFGCWSDTFRSLFYLNGGTKWKRTQFVLEKAWGPKTIAGPGPVYFVGVGLEKSCGTFAIRAELETDISRSSEVEVHKEQLLGNIGEVARRAAGVGGAFPYITAEQTTKLRVRMRGFEARILVVLRPGTWSRI